jgi:hypothetical protein
MVNQPQLQALVSKFFQSSVALVSEALHPYVVREAFYFYVALVFEAFHSNVVQPLETFIAAFVDDHMKSFLGSAELFAIPLANRIVGSCLSFLRPILPLGALEYKPEAINIKLVGKAMLGFTLDRNEEALAYLTLLPRGLWPSLMMKECFPETL